MQAEPAKALHVVHSALRVIDLIQKRSLARLLRGPSRATVENRLIRIF